MQLTLSQQGKYLIKKKPNKLIFLFQVADESPPVFELLNVMSAECTKDMHECGNHQWELTASVTDRNGTGIEKVLLNVGDGNIQHTSLSASVVQLTYRASCCSLGVEIIAVDHSGNKGVFEHSVVPSASPPALGLSLPLWLCLLMSTVMGRL